MENICRAIEIGICALAFAMALGMFFDNVNLQKKQEKFISGFCKEPVIEEIK